MLPPKRISGVLRTIMVSSGKGGVGKSTISANLAVSLAHMGKSIGLLDCDVFGPSIPRLMGLADARAQDPYLPLMNHGVKCMSMGFLSDNQLTAWRGLMVMKCLQQLLWNVQWGSLDYLILDMPPGTGDTHLTVCQQVQIDGAVVVSTPQKIALEATEKGLLLLRKMNVNILGMVENMKYLECTECGHLNQVFEDHTSEFCAKHSIELLSSIPFERKIAKNSDQGKALIEISNYYEPILAKIFALEQVETM